MHCAPTPRLYTSEIHPYENLIIHMESENLTGGNSNQVRREQNTVVRQCGKWSPFVHQLLQFLTEHGFEASPQFIESDGIIERLTFIEGTVGNDPLQPSMLSDDILIEAAKLLRQFHDLTANFVIPDDAQFFFDLDRNTPYEVICHNDFAPYNCVYHDGHLVGIIDFDTAAPGTRLWDLAYAVYRFVPLGTDQHCMDLGWESPPDRESRLRKFCDAYGLTQRDNLIDTVVKRIQELVKYMQDTSSNLDHLPVYFADIAYVRKYQQQFEMALHPEKP